MINLKILKVLVKSFNCEDRSCFVVNPREAQTVCPRWRVLTVSVKAGAWSGCSSWAPHFSCKFPYKVALVVKCWHAFRLRRLAQSLRPGSGMFPANFRIQWLLWHVEMHFDCAGSHKVWSHSFWGAAFILSFFVKCWSAFRLRRLAQSVVL